MYYFLLKILHKITVITNKWKATSTKMFNLLIGPVTKLENLSDVHSILLGAVENYFQLVIQKESYEIASNL